MEKQEERERALTEISPSESEDLQNLESSKSESESENESLVLIRDGEDIDIVTDSNCEDSTTLSFQTIYFSVV